MKVGAFLVTFGLYCHTHDTFGQLWVTFNFPQINHFFRLTATGSMRPVSGLPSPALRPLQAWCLFKAS